MRESKNCSSYFTKFSISLDGIWYVVESADLMNLMLILLCPMSVQEMDFF